jgi:hypothetical protein
LPSRRPHRHLKPDGQVGRQCGQQVYQRKFTFAGDHPVAGLVPVPLGPLPQRVVAQLHVAEHRGVQRGHVGGARAAPRHVHGVHEQAEVRPADVAHRGQRGGQVAHRQRGGVLERGRHAPLGCLLGEGGELVKAAREVGVDRHHVGPARPQLPHHVQVGRIGGQVDPWRHHEAFGQRDRDAGVSQGARHLAPQVQVVDEGERGEPVRVVRHVASGGRFHRDPVAPERGGEVHEVGWRISQDGLVLDAYRGAIGGGVSRL